ncbi:uncharacterized protein PG986_012579 [Apiospora aurea]|uniref:Uncharacterized protein n=1 Tax=Apiospora aurea TaxID=335848 RepID=A0ABR1Q0D5_9PEZI
MPADVATSVDNHRATTTDTVSSSIDYDDDLPPPPAAFHPSDDYGMPPTVWGMITHVVGGVLFFFGLGLLAMMTIAVAGGALLLVLFGLGTGVYHGYSWLNVRWKQCRRRRRRRRSELIAAVAEEGQDMTEEDDDDDDDSDDSDSDDSDDSDGDSKEEKNTPSTSSASSSSCSVSGAAGALARRGAGAPRPSKLPKRTG